MSDIETAKRVVETLVREQRNAGDRIQNVEKQIDDLKLAQRLIDESIKTPSVVYNDDTELRSFIKEDGSVQWTTEVKTITNNRGHRVTIEESGLLDAETPCNDWHAELKTIAQDRHLARMLMADPYTPKLDARLYRHLNKAPRTILPSVNKAFNDQAGTGAEFIPDQFVSDLYQAFTLPKRLRSLLTRVQADRNTLLIPRLNRGGRPYIKGEITVDSPLAQYTTSTPSTGDKTINIKGLATSYILDDAAVEDSALAILPIFSQQIAQDIEDAFEDCMINGDTAGTHQDDIANWNVRSRWGASGLGGSSDHRRAFLGMRAAAYDQASQKDQGTTLSSAEILEGMSKLGELGASGLVMVVSPEFMINHLMGLTELITIDKFGANASIVAGQIGSIFGIPVVMSRFLSADLESSGLFLNSGSKDKTGYLLFNASSWYLYERRGIVLEQDKDISAGAIRLVATYRAVMGSPDESTINNVFYGYNFSI